MHLINKVLLALTLSPLTASADEGLDHATKLQDLSSEIFLSTMSDFLPKLDLKVMLESCSLPDLASRISIDTETEMHKIREAYDALPASRKFDCNKKDCTADEFALVGINRNMRTAYMLGFKQALELTIQQHPAICKWARDQVTTPDKGAQN